MKRFTAVLLSAIVGLIFLFSAYSKLFPIETFEYTLVGSGFINWEISVIVARLIICIEFVLGVLFLFSLTNKNTLYFTSALLVLFSLHLFYQLIIKGNQIDCGCFGSLLSMTPIQAIIKNMLLLLIIYGITKFKFSINLKIKYKSIYLFILSMIIVFIINPVDFNYSKSYLDKPFSHYKLALEPLYTYHNNDEFEQPKLDLRKGKFIVAFLNPSCEHCKLAAQKLSVIHTENPNIPIYIFVRGDDKEINAFTAKYYIDKLPYSKLNGQLFFALAGAQLPSIYYLNNSIVEKHVDHSTLEQSHIETWLQK